MTGLKFKKMNKADKEFFRLLFAIDPFLAVRMYKLQSLSKRKSSPHDGTRKIPMTVKPKYDYNH